MRTLTLVLLVSLTVIVFAGCSAKVDGPAPQVAGLAPSLVCGEQHVTAVTISGEGLSPLAIDSATGDPLLAIPAVALRRAQDLSGATVTDAPVVLPNDPNDPASARVRWTSAMEMAFDVYPELALPPGLYEVTVTNRNGKSFVASAALTVVPRPTLASVAPDLLCVEQEARALTLTGTGFLNVNGTLPTVAIGDVVLPVDSLGGCQMLPGATPAMTCTTAAVTVPQGMLTTDPQAKDVVVENPAPAACHTEEPVTIAVVPAPTLASVVPDLICDAQGDRTLTLAGTGFVTVGQGAGATLPMVTIGAFVTMAETATDCTPVTGTLLDAQQCATLTVVVPSGTFAPGAPQTFDVAVTNPDPAGCTTTQLVTVAVVPPPSLTAVVPDLVCLDEGARTVTLSGSDFVVVAGTMPTVTIGAGVFTPDSASGCVDISGTLLDAQRCDTLVVTVPTGALAAGSHGVTVGNPDPAGCSSVENVTIAVVPEPVVTQVTPDLFCADGGGVTLTIDGAGFLRVGADLPIVSFGGSAVLADGVAGCAPVAGTLLAADACTSLTVTLASGVVPPGAHDVTVENPQPAGCSSNEIVTVAAAGAPQITGVMPSAVCAIAQPATMEVVGSGFLIVSGASPSVTVDGAPAAVVTLGGCVAVPGSMLAVQSCTSITFAAPVGGFAVGAHVVDVENPAPAGCTAPASGTFDVAGAPNIVAVTPFKVCGPDGDLFVVDGTGFVAGSQIVLTPSGGGAAMPVSTTFAGATQLEGTIAPGAVPSGLYDVTVQNGLGCEDTLAAALNVVEAPIVFFVDPPQAYNGINLQATVYVSGINDDVMFVGIRPTGTMAMPASLAFTYDPLRPNRILATIPAGTAAGDYDVVIQDVACGAELVNGLHVTGTLNVAVSAIDPPFGASTESTGVAILSNAPPPAGLSNFLPTPTAYLNPVGGAGLARELRAVSFQSATRLTAVVPDGLPVGDYDLIIINPDGGVGLLPSTYRVLAAPAPRIDTLSPGLVTNQAAQAVTVLGATFAAPVTVQATCRDSAGATTVVSAAVGATTATSIATTWNMSVLGGGEVCVVRVQNADATYGDFSALTVTSPSNNLNAFTADSPMVVGRRAAAGAAVRMNAVSRFLFAIGGDAGAATPAHATVEAAPVDPFGDVGSWTIQANPLPAGRTFVSAAVIGRHIYVAGGRVGAAPTTSVLRAYLLDPLEAAEIDDLDLATAMGSGLEGGIWYYRVAAVMGAGDPNNPGGEALASEPLVVQLPALPERIHLTLRWTAVPGASAYRIYRSPAPGAIGGDERFLAETAAAPLPSFTDDGSLTVDPTRPVMPLGSLGVWHEVGPLGTAREGAAIVAVRDPNVAGLRYLYVIGGRNSAGTALATYEWTSITSAAPDDQVVAGFSGGGSTLPTGRWQVGAVAVDATVASAVPATGAWIYVMPGTNGPATADVNEVTAFQVDTADGGAGPNDGRLGAAVPVESPNTGGGYAYAVGNEYLYILGAAGGTPSASGRSAKICDVGEAGCGGPPLEPPDLVNWNAGITLGTARYLHATAVESGFIFLLGGQTNTEAASASTERTNF